jgi:hypothetical protein
MRAVSFNWFCESDEVIMRSETKHTLPKLEPSITQANFLPDSDLEKCSSSQGRYSQNFSR